MIITKNERVKVKPTVGASVWLIWEIAGDKYDVICCRSTKRQASDAARFLVRLGRKILISRFDLDSKARYFDHNHPKGTPVEWEQA